MLILAQAAKADLAAVPAGSVFPGVPLGDQWPSGFVDEAMMTARIDAALNGAASWMNTLGTGFAFFLAVGAAQAALATNVGWGTVVTDTAHGWNATSKAYVIPSPGTYALLAGFSQSSAFPADMQLVGLPAGYRPLLAPRAGATAQHGMQVEQVGVVFAGGESVAVQYRGTAPNAEIVAGQYTTYFMVVQIGGS